VGDKTDAAESAEPSSSQAPPLIPFADIKEHITTHKELMP